jgi:hypothetical protein
MRQPARCRCGHCSHSRQVLQLSDWVRHRPASNLVIVGHVDVNVSFIVPGAAAGRNRVALLRPGEHAERHSRARSAWAAVPCSGITVSEGGKPFHPGAALHRGHYPAVGSVDHTHVTREYHPHWPPGIAAQQGGRGRASRPVCAASRVATSVHDDSFARACRRPCGRAPSRCLGRLPADDWPRNDRERNHSWGLECHMPGGSQLHPGRQLVSAGGKQVSACGLPVHAGQARIRRSAAHERAMTIDDYRSRGPAASAGLAGRGERTFSAAAARPRRARYRRQ